MGRWATWIVGCVLAQGAWTVANAAAPALSGPTPPVHSTAHAPATTAHKASSFAPHATRSRSFGAPIQSPVLRRVKPKKSAAPR